MQQLYGIINKKSGKFYVGRSINAKKRMTVHKNSLNEGKHINGYLQNAWNKDHESFEFEIFHTIDTGNDEKDLNLIIECEQAYLDEFMKIDMLYNLSSSALGPQLFGEKNGSYGKKVKDRLSPEAYQRFKDKISGKGNGFYGKKHTPETIEILRQKCPNYGEKNGFYGKKHTPESKKLMSEKLKANAQKPDYKPSRAKKVRINNIEYRSMAEAKRHIGMNHKNIKLRCLDPTYKNFEFI